MLRVIVVDDEQPSLHRLEKLLINSGQVQVTGAFSDSLQALEHISYHKTDAVFLDIEMPDMDGIELAGRILDLQGYTAIVFVTAYNQYAIEAFHMNALDYLLKPVTEDRLNETLKRIMKLNILPAFSDQVTVKCFGKFSVSTGSQVIRFRTEKAEELFAYLIDNKGAFVSRSRILDSLWEDFDGDRAVVHLNSTLHNIKKALLYHGIQISIQYDRGSYRMDLTDINCDYIKFTDLFDHTGECNKEDLPSYIQAETLYSGEYLSGWDFEWVAGKRLVLEEKYIYLLLKISGYYSQTGKFQEATNWLRAGLRHEPLHRELNYRLIENLLSANERIMAAKYFELYKNGLIKNLKQEPDEDFQNLREQL